MTHVHLHRMLTFAAMIVAAAVLTSCASSAESTHADAGCELVLADGTTKSGVRVDSVSDNQVHARGEAIPVGSIEEVRIPGRRHTGEGAMIGGLAGGAIGLLAAPSPSSSRTNDGSSFGPTVTVSPVVTMALGAVIGTGAGALVGAIAGRTSTLDLRGTDPGSREERLKRFIGKK